MLENAKKDIYENEHTCELQNILEQWAKCYRHEAGINTNMYVESFHKAFKYGENYLKGK